MKHFIVCLIDNKAIRGARAYQSGARIVFNRVIKFDIVILEPWSAHQRIKERKRRFSHFLGESRAYVELWITRQNIHIQLSTFTWIVTISTLWSGTKPVCFDIVHTMLPVRLLLLLLFIVQQQQQGQQQQQEPNEFYSVAYFKRCQFFGFSLNTPQCVCEYTTRILFSVNEAQTTAECRMNREKKIRIWNNNNNKTKTGWRSLTTKAV